MPGWKYILASQILSGPTHAQRAFFSWRPSGAEDASRECGSPPSWLTGSVPGKGEWSPPTCTAHREESTRTGRGEPPSSGAQVAAPSTPLSFLPTCSLVSATLLLGDCLLQPHSPHCLSPLTWPFPSCWLGWQWGRVLRRWPLGSDSLRLNPSLHLPSGLQWARGLTI